MTKPWKPLYWRTAGLMLLLFVTLPISASFLNARNDFMLVAGILWPIGVLYFIINHIIKIIKED